MLLLPSSFVVAMLSAAAAAVVAIVASSLSVGWHWALENEHAGRSRGLLKVLDGRWCEVAEITHVMGNIVGNLEPVLRVRVFRGYKSLYPDPYPR